MAPKNIWVAASDGLLDRVEELITKENVSVDAKDENGYTPLHAAVSYNHLYLVEYLLAHNANVNITDNDSDTPLHVCETVECAIFLVNRRADINHQNSEGLKPHESAEENEHYDVANYLRRLLNLPEVEPPTEEPEGDDDDDEGMRVEIPILETLNQHMNGVGGSGDMPSDEQLQEIATKMIMDALARQADPGPS
ncbi:hypothetical protein H4R33_004523 [Dimargaris cristalligena]|nr:hypothetical protein H4R33_004523 [Dimargaris cristalligena]